MSGACTGKYSGLQGIKGACISLNCGSQFNSIKKKHHKHTVTLQNSLIYKSETMYIQSHFQLIGTNCNNISMTI